MIILTGVPFSLAGGEMESILALGCIITKSSTALRITSDPKERWTAAIFATVLGVSPLLVIVLAPFAKVGWAGLIVFGAFGIGWLFLAFLIGLCWTEIEFNRNTNQLIHNRFCLGRVRSKSAIALDQLQSIRVVEKGKGAGELQLLQVDGKVWAKWVFLVMEVAQETREEILDWLKDSSGYTNLKSDPKRG